MNIPHQSHRFAIRPLMTLLALILIWQLLITLFDLPDFILPSPMQVFITIWHHTTMLLHHSWVTLQEMLIGLLLGLMAGLSLAVVMIGFTSVRQGLLPVLIISQAIPVFALAPLLMLWLGYGIASKVVIAAIIIFFPLTTCCFDGLNTTPKSYLELSKSMGASPWQQLISIRLPAALPAIASGIRIAVVVAPIGAITGEWVGSSAGLGYLMLQANARMRVDDMFAALFCLSCVSVALYFITDNLLKKIIYWNVY